MADKAAIEKSKTLITALTDKIAAFPCDIDPRVKAKEQHLLASGQAFVEGELEKDRISAVVAKHEEQHPPHQIECPICLEDVKVISQYSIQYFLCCGKSICWTCAQSRGGMEMKTCPMCRAPKITVYNERVVKRLKKNAASGIASAQAMLGGHYLGLSSPERVATNVKEGVRLMQLAAEQGEPSSLTQLAYFHQLGLYGLEQSKEIVNEMMTKAACAGFCMAQSSLAFSYSAKEDYTMAVKYATLACRSTTHDTNTLHPAALLGKLFYLGGGGLEKNLYLARFYLEVSEKCSSGNMTNHLILAKTLLELSEKNYGTRHPPAGYSSIPRVLYLLSKSIDRDEDTSIAQELIKELEIQNKCANCGREAESMPTKKLKQCAVCEAVSYCSRECQVKHWKDGHKSDCVKKYRPLEGLARFLPPGVSPENATLIGPDGKLINMKDLVQQA